MGNLARTSKGFRELSLDRSLWKQTSWTVSAKDLLNHQETWLLLFSRLERLEHLKIDGRSSVSMDRRSGRHESLTPVSIKSLEIEMVNQEDIFEIHPDLAAVVGLFSNLTSVNFGYTVLSENILKILSSNCPKLEKFESIQTYYDHWMGVDSLVTNCPNLKVIRILDENGIDGIDDGTIKKIGECCKNLEILDTGLSYNVSDLGMQSVVTNCTKLRELTLAETDITDKTLELLGRNCPYMEALKLDCCDNVTEAGVRHFVEQGTKPLKLEVLVEDDDQFGSYEVEYLAGLRREYGRLVGIEEQ